MVHAGSPAKARGRSLHVVQLDRKADSKYSGSPESIRNPLYSAVSPTTACQRRYTRCP